MAMLPRCSFRAVIYILFLIVCLSLSRLSLYEHGDIHADIRQAYRNVRFGRKHAFIETSMQTSIDGPFDNRPIQKLCASRTWREDLIVTCRAPQGGVGNVRNVFLNCVRYAIEAGAAFVVPRIIARSDRDLLTLKTKTIVDFGHFFDLKHFIPSLQEGCPQMKLYNHLNELYDIPSTAKALLLSPQDLSQEFDHGTVLAHPSDWRKSFDEWVQSQTPPLPRNRPILVELNTPLLQFPLSYDEPAFVHNFGRILKFRPDTVRLSSAVLYELSRQFFLNLAPDERIAPHAFMGAHLRTEADAASAGWTGYDAQANAYIQQALLANLSVIYVASGNQDDNTRLREQASQHSINVTTKMDLLSGPDLETLNALTWDQQALVDFEVLLRSSTFGGVSESSFAWNIALRRNWMSKKKDFLTGEGGQAFEDGLSWLYGAPGRLTLFAYSMWP